MPAAGDRHITVECHPACASLRAASFAALRTGTIELALRPFKRNLFMQSSNGCAVSIACGALRCDSTPIALRSAIQHTFQLGLRQVSSRRRIRRRSGACWRYRRADRRQAAADPRACPPRRCHDHARRLTMLPADVLRLAVPVPPAFPLRPSPAAHHAARNLAPAAAVEISVPATIGTSASMNARSSRTSSAAMRSKRATRCGVRSASMRIAFTPVVVYERMDVLSWGHSCSDAVSRNDRAIF